MATKKKTRPKRTKSKRTAGKKAAAKKKVAPRKAEVGTKTGGRKRTGGKTARSRRKQVQGKSRSADRVALGLEGLAARSGQQSGDLQGLSKVQRADSESVDELLEEGNAFEAEAVKGVEDAEDTEEGEVRTHEVPQDDVPGEYRDKE